jgi:uncharacterized protein YdeI (YjbR/CyaY-like superfamily)
MDITEVFYPTSRADWRAWLEDNHRTKTEVWVQLYTKASGKFSLSYNDLVEECLCFGWIDGTVKKHGPDGRVQRVTPRRKKSYLSELNRQRVWKLQRLGLMTPAGLEALGDQIGSSDEPLKIPDWVKTQLQADEEVWKNFGKFPHEYQRLKISWIADLPASRRAEAQKRLDYLIKMTRQGKMYGTIPE